MREPEPLDTGQIGPEGEPDPLQANEVKAKVTGSIVEWATTEENEQGVSGHDKHVRSGQKQALTHSTRYPSPGSVAQTPH